MRTYENSRNPILPPEIHIPDGEPHVMPDGKLYVYGSFDERRAGEGEAYCSGKYHVVSTPDGRRWTIHDTALDVEEIPWAGAADTPRYPSLADWAHPTPFMIQMIREMTKGKSAEELMEMGKQYQEQMAAKEGKDLSGKKPELYAPDCAFQNGKYYLYFCTSDGLEGVAVSDRPEGPFRNAAQLPCGGIDPAVFVDDDGQAYYYWDQFFSRGVPLNEDMVSFDPDRIRENLVTEEEHHFHEGSSMRKIGDTYYYIFADVERGKPTALGYATAGSPMGPFVYRGIIIDSADCDPESWNNHGSIECFNGQWVVCYHRSSHNSRANRRMCMEKITVLPDGTIPEVKMTSQGLGEPFRAGERMEGFRVCGLTGGAYVGGPFEDERIVNLSAGCEMIFRYLDGTETYKAAELEGTGRGELEIRLDGHPVGVFCLEGDGTARAGLHMEGLEKKAGGYEIRLVCRKAENLEIRSLTFQN